MFLYRFFIGYIYLFPIDLYTFCGKNFIDRRFKISLNFPIFFRYKAVNLFLTFTNKSHGYCLNSSGTQTTIEYFPEKWTNLITKDSIQYPSRLLSIHQISINPSRMFYPRFYTAFCDLIKKNTLQLFLI